MNRRTILAIGLTLFLLVTACSGGEIAEQIIESQDGVGDVEIDENDGTVQIEIEDDEGNTQAVIGGGDIPDDFPVPVPNGGTVLAVLTQTGSQSVSLIYPDDDFDSLKDFFADYVEGSGGSVSTYESSSPPSAAWTIDTGSGTISITVTSSDGEVSVGIAVVESG